MCAITACYIFPLSLLYSPYPHWRPQWKPNMSANSVIPCSTSPIMSVFSPLYTSPNMVSIIWLFEHLYLIIVITILYIKNYMCIYAFVFLCLFFLCVYTVIRFLTLLITPDTRLLLDTNTDSDSPSLWTLLWNFFFNLPCFAAWIMIYYSNIIIIIT